MDLKKKKHFTPKKEDSFLMKGKGHIDRYLKNDVSKSIVHAIKHANFQLYTVHPDGVI